MQRELSVRYLPSTLEILCDCRAQTEPSPSLCVCLVTWCECWRCHLKPTLLHFNKRLKKNNLLIRTTFLWSQGAPGLGSAEPAAASDAQRVGEHAAGQRSAHHHQVPTCAQERVLVSAHTINMSFNPFLLCAAGIKKPVEMSSSSTQRD